METVSSASSPARPAASDPSTWRSFRRHSWTDRVLFVEAVCCLGAARLVVVLLPFRVFSRYLGAAMAESPEDGHSSSLAVLRRVAWSIAAASRRAPWRCLCLEQGIAGKMMLRVRGVPNTLYLGVARGNGAGMTAHAWLRSGAVYLTGGAGHTQYTIVSKFADRALVD